MHVLKNPALSFENFLDSIVMFLPVEFHSPALAIKRWIFLVDDPVVFM
jgi:hypothetical protein